MTEPTQQPQPIVAEAPDTARRRLRLAQGVLLLFHVTGFLGLGFAQDKSFYLQFVPLNLLLTAGLLIAFQPRRDATFWSFVVVTMLVGFFVEVAGIRTGLIFGQYEYGPTLGPQWLDVPLIIGLNWFMLVLMGGSLANYLKLSGFLKAVVGALLLVGMDLCIEPVAVKYDFWDWRYNIIPLQNFKGWFAVALILLVYFNRLEISRRNPLVPFLYLLQLLFFFGLSMLA
ncbi:carotenoid biosynthesis protein [Hymenobacter fodinae]|uniref:Carotenoid biosynthesis protein n=1 Tax=Hymenobacter fodinae TaxID=2510796 RepID=A0A4Z0P9M8_9BACT|nr:carotenoid biosynthesis protein [Hymenobacter fodinae]TGE09377.1 carotenoid biosynthesis protein [Hymenobacter fodinae]